MKNRTYKIALFAILGAVALVLNFLEGLIPVSAFMPPGAKAGFSNIATMLAASTLGIVPALAITLIKAGFAIITRGVTAGAMSLCGGVLSTVTMYLLFKFSKKTGYLVIGVVSALMHNIGQLAVAAVLVGNTAVLGYAPVLLVSGIVTGALTGSILRAVMPPIIKLFNNSASEGGKE